MNLGNVITELFYDIIFYYVNYKLDLYFFKISLTSNFHYMKTQV